MRKILLVSMIGVLLLPAVSFTGDSMEGRSGTRFTGVFSDSGIDKNGDGYFEQLMVTGEIEIDSCVEAAVVGRLAGQNGHTISRRPDMYYTEAISPAKLVSDSGKTVFHIFFSGEDIRMRKTDGPFKAALMIWCGDSFTDTTYYETSAYYHTAFKETPAGIWDHVYEWIQSLSR